ncbi:hypothetical protein B4N89_27735 [Embleya scabrispora]|uniref:Uncharacterized protein n=1 Tax=Embleya scabrispora TaxID=159449 RepID=A0A1T3P5J4_9ACTN|nr:hypothetical protein [Embleya scabrispora]OPC84215.1 hypothetical protein B4N89_27735 [Embleya scabrispora]
MITLVEVRRNRLTRKHLAVPVARAGAAPDPAWGVEFAFVDRDTRPGDADWITGEWDGPRAQILVGPGGTATPAVGIHTVWLRITAAPELVVEPVGILDIT